MTPFALAHLAATWGQLRSLCIDVPAAAAEAHASAQPGRQGSPRGSAAAPGAAGSAGGGSSGTGTAEDGGDGDGGELAHVAALLRSLSGYTQLQHLTLRILGALSGVQQAAGARTEHA